MKKITKILLATLIWCICAAVGFYLYILGFKIFEEAVLLIAPILFLLLCLTSNMWEDKYLGTRRPCSIRMCGTTVFVAFLLFIAAYVLILVGIEYYEEAGMFAALNAYGFGAFGLVHFLDSH